MIFNKLLKGGCFMSKNEKDVFTVRNVAQTWTSPKMFEIVKNDNKVILSLHNRDDAESVCEYLNKNACKKGGRPKGSKNKKKKTETGTDKKKKTKKE